MNPNVVVPQFNKGTKVFFNFSFFLTPIFLATDIRRRKPVLLKFYLLD